jgi:hypothetical protein
MKTMMYVIAALAMMIGMELRAQETGNSYKTDKLLTMVEVSKLIADDRDAHSPVIRALSTYLTKDQRDKLYSAHKVSAAGPFFANLVFGFGVGSYLQGDVTSGVMSTISTSAGLLLATGTLSRDDGLQTAGLLMLAAGKLIDIVAPFVYASSSNRRLERDLRGLTVDLGAAQIVGPDNTRTIAPRIGVRIGL